MVARSELPLAGNDNASVIRADLRKLDTILDTPETRRLLDLQEPLGVLMVGVMQFVPDADDPWAIAAGYREHLMRMLDGFELVEAGLLYTSQRRPESTEDRGDRPHHSDLYAAIGRKL